jgi:hypothetical protein
MLGCLAFRPGTKYMRVRYLSVKFIQFFDYYSWDSNQILSELHDMTGWEIPDGIAMDWHSDCVFHVFKEYMYQKMIGASYTDAFLSNQVRHGLIARKQAWEKLLHSKKYNRNALKVALSKLDLEHLKPKIDFSCFDIEQSPA